MTTRREFTAGMAAMFAKSGYEPKLMLQPYVWTQQLKTEKVELKDGLERIFSASSAVVIIPTAPVIMPVSFFILSAKGT